MHNSHILLTLQQNFSAFKLTSNNFLRETYVQNKHKRGNQKKVHEVTTVGNIKYEPILRT